jgi:hypothetical protein
MVTETLLIDRSMIEASLAGASVAIEQEGVKFLVAGADAAPGKQQ